MKGTNVTTGYYKREDKTAEAFDEEGWFCSGDVGEIYPNGSLRIIDRAKNIFKLSQGEYIAPEKLENIFINLPLVGQIMVCGDSLQDCVVGVVPIDEVECTGMRGAACSRFTMYLGVYSIHRTSHV